MMLNIIEFSGLRVDDVMVPRVDIVAVDEADSMQELLAIPDRNRTDAEWDELNELEIALASGNRPGAPDPQQQQRRSMGVMPGGQPKMGGGRPQQGKNQGGGGGGGGKKFHKRPGKRRGGGGGGGGGGPQQPQ